MGTSESLDGPTVQKLVQFLEYRGNLMQCLHDSALRSQAWEIAYISPPRIPKQTDGHNCGLFTCAYASLICAGMPRALSAPNRMKKHIDASRAANREPTDFFYRV
jgi:hypothetical protein